MKTARALLFSLPLLLSCGNGSSSGLKGNPDDYFRIDFYSDYQGIDYSSPDISKAELLGHAYVLKTAENRSAFFSNESADDPYDFVSAQSSSAGHYQDFIGWTGYYEEGTSFDGSSIGGESIDLDDVKGSGAVFATFELKAYSYQLSIFDNGESLYLGMLEYGSEVTLDFESQSYSFLDERGEFSYSPPDYHTEGEFAGFEVITYVALEDGSSAEQSQTYDYSTTIPVTQRTRIESVYREYQSSFALTLSSPLGLPEEAIWLDGDGSYQIVYDEGVYGQNGSLALDGLKEEVAFGGRSFSLTGFQGVYGDGEDVPESLRGKSVDPNHIRFDCTLSPVYSENPIAVFLSDSLGNDLGTINAKYGEPASLPSVPDSNGYTFSGTWLCDGAAFDPSTPIEGPLSLVAEMVEREVEREVNVGGEARESLNAAFEYSLFLEGYELTSLNYKQGQSQDDFENGIGPVDLASLSLEKPIKGVRPLSGDCLRNIVSLAFPESLQSLSPSAFSSLSRLQSIDLSSTNLKTIGFHAFKDCLSLLSVLLPSGLGYIGYSAFEGCQNLNSFELNGASTASFDPDWFLGCPYLESLYA